MLTFEDHLRRMIGDLVFTVAKLQAELEALREAAGPPPHPAPHPPPARED